jgi:hypothetical protein
MYESVFPPEVSSDKTSCIEKNSDYKLVIDYEFFQSQNYHLIKNFD